MHLDIIDACRTTVHTVDTQIHNVMSSQEDLLERLQKIPGIDPCAHGQAFALGIMRVGVNGEAAGVLCESIQ